MRFFPTRPLSAYCATAVAAAAACLLMIVGAHSASAQGAAETIKIGDVRLGGFIPVNTDFKNTYANLIFAGGLDYFIAQKAGINRTSLGVDYIQRNSGDKNIRIIPVTISEQYYGGGGTGKTRAFFGIGAGAYFLHIKDPENTDVQGTKDPTTAGGFLEAGLDFGSALFLDARYHIIGEEYRTKPTGLQVSLGARF